VEAAHRQPPAAVDNLRPWAVHPDHRHRPRPPCRTHRPAGRPSVADRNTRRHRRPTTSRHVRCGFRGASVRLPRPSDRDRGVRRNYAPAPARNVRPAALGRAPVRRVRDLEHLERPGGPPEPPAYLALLSEGVPLEGAPLVAPAPAPTAQTRSRSIPAEG
jgi:hypothetical protein